MNLPNHGRMEKAQRNLKKRVRITDPAGIIEGEAIDLDEDGAF
jgi:biotin-(acetyl-CoA carboxylase) ligase